MSLKKKLVFISNHSRVVISTHNLSTQKMEARSQLRTCANLKQIRTTDRVPVSHSNPQRLLMYKKQMFITTTTAFYINQERILWVLLFYCVALAGLKLYRPSWLHTQ